MVLKQLNSGTFVAYPEYWQRAKDYESIFRGILRDIKKNYRIPEIPKELDINTDLDGLLKGFALADFEGSFSVTDFRVAPFPDIQGIFDGLNPKEVIIAVHHSVSFDPVRQRGGSVLKYLATANDLEYLGVAALLVDPLHGCGVFSQKYLEGSASLFDFNLLKKH